jgi:hypothetical protein
MPLLVKNNLKSKFYKTRNYVCMTHKFQLVWVMKSISETHFTQSGKMKMNPDSSYFDKVWCFMKQRDQKIWSQVARAKMPVALW